jgi:uncharacterized protein YndB with AHSA1/START domain
VARPPDVVFDYLTSPSNLADWQTSKTSVEQLTDGPPGLGTRVRRMAVYHENLRRNVEALPTA